VLTGCLLLIACSNLGSSVAPVPKSVVQDSGESVRSCLAAAVQFADPPERGRRAIALCYRTYFEPLEPTLRAHNPRATLSLEYGFGKLAAELSSRSEPQELALGAAMLADRVESVLATLPTVASKQAAHPGDTGGLEVISGP
jgi:hypothetical protein